MTDIEERALELWGPGIAAEVNLHNFAILGSAFIEMRDRHEAFKQEVSDVAEAYIEAGSYMGWEGFDRFIIPKAKPDPLVEVCKEWWDMDIRENDAETLRELLEARGLEIREKGQ